MEVKIIYNGGYIPTLGICVDPDYSSYQGWLVYKHPDGQWVTLADLKPVVQEMQRAEMATMSANLEPLVKP